MEELDKNIIKMYQSGTRVAEICRTLGTHTQKVYKVLKENNISKNGRRLTPEVIQEIVEKLRMDMSSTKLAEQYGCSVWTIHKIMREYDIPMQVGRPWRRRKDKPEASPSYASLHESIQITEMPDQLRALVMAPENRTYIACFHKSKKEVASAAEAVSFLYSVMSRRFTLSTEDVSRIEKTFTELQSFDKPRQTLVCPLSINENIRFKIVLAPEVNAEYSTFQKSRDESAVRLKKSDWRAFNPGMYGICIPVGVYSEKGDAVKFYDFKGTVKAECKEQAYERALDELKAEIGDDRFNSLKVPGKYSDKVTFSFQPMA
ncbi:hypothetical protein [uncultured Bacteroides sp.]|uniref:hypothetical protein n=1 Tax=uncultured Bacteroides sp. TaxID=162156 RepID=UPI00280A9EF0|nr:hypothetical protein [uncultured Bacteroides sp.]